VSAATADEYRRGARDCNANSMRWRGCFGFHNLNPCKNRSWSTDFLHFGTGSHMPAGAGSHMPALPLPSSRDKNRCVVVSGLAMDVVYPYSGWSTKKEQRPSRDHL
jgi:hypothetical protein